MKEVGESYGVGVWRTIRNGWEAFKNRTSFTVGSRVKAKFLKDK